MEFIDIFLRNPEVSVLIVILFVLAYLNYKQRPGFSSKKGNIITADDLWHSKKSNRHNGGGGDGGSDGPDGDDGDDGGGDSGGDGGE